MPVVALLRAASSASSAARPQAFTEVLTIVLPGAEAAQATTVALCTTAGRQVYASGVPLSAPPQVLSGLPTLTPGLCVLRTGTTNRGVSYN